MLRKEESWLCMVTDGTRRASSTKLERCEIKMCHNFSYQSVLYEATTCSLASFEIKSDNHCTVLHLMTLIQFKSSIVVTIGITKYEARTEEIVNRMQFYY